MLTDKNIKLIDKYFVFLKSKFKHLSFLWITKTDKKVVVTYKCNIHNKIFSSDYYSLKKSKYGCKLCAKTTKFYSLDDYLAVLPENIKEKYTFLSFNRTDTSFYVEVRCNTCGNTFTTNTLHKKKVSNISLGCKYCYNDYIRKNSKDKKEHTKKYYIASFYSSNSKYELKDIFLKNGSFYYHLYCKEHDKHFYPQCYDFIYRKTECPVCASNKIAEKQAKTLTYYENKANSVHNGKYEYLSLKRINGNSVLVIKCNKCGYVFEQSTGNHITNKSGCPKCAMSGISAPESEVKEFLESLGLTNIKSNYRQAIYPYEIDLFLPDYNLGIEYNGLYWHSEQVNKNITHIDKKRKLALSQGINLINIYEDDWLFKKDIVKSVLEYRLNVTNMVTIYARKCNIQSIDASLYTTFNTENHIMGNRNAKYKIGLFYNDELVAVAGFSDKELIRFTVKKRYKVVGGLGKITKWFLRNVNTYLFTYVDLDYFTGASYKKVGYKVVEETTPKYWYVSNKTTQRMSRYIFQKHKLADKLENFDATLTERENCNNNGYYRFFGCSNLKLEISI